MKSFLRIILNTFRKVNPVVDTIANDLVPFAPAIEVIPGFGSVFGVVLQGILIAEQLLSPANSGPQKKAVATAVVNTVHPGLDPVVVSGVIDALVAALNHLNTALPAAAPAAA